MYMEDNCSIKPRNLREFMKSSWFLKPLQGIVIGTILGLILFSVAGSNPYTSNIYGDILAGNVMGLFFINIPCLTCSSEKNFD
jgi:hypothetical protein